MAATAEVRLQATGAHQVSRQLGKVTGGLNKVGRKAAFASRALSRSFSKIKGTFAGLPGALGIGIGGAAIAAGTKKVLDFNDALANVQVDSERTTQHMAKLRDQVLQTSAEFGRSKDGVASILAEFQSSGGMLDTGSAMLEVMAKFATATGAADQQVGRLGVALAKSGIATEDILDAMAKINKATDLGTQDIRQFSTVASKVLQGGSIFGGGGIRGVEESLAVFQRVGSLFLGSPREATTAFEAILRGFTQKGGKIKSLGVRTEERDKATGKIRTRGIVDLLQDIFKVAAKRNKGRLNLDSISALKIFEGESLKALIPLVKDFDATTGKFAGETRKMLDGVRSVNRTLVERKFDIRTQGIGKEGQQLREAMSHLDNTMTRFATKHLPTVFENPLETLAIAGAGLVTAQVATSAMVAALAGAAPAIGVAIGGAIIGAGLGKVLNDWLGLSDMLFDAIKAIAKFFGVDEVENSRKREEAREAKKFADALRIAGRNVRDLARLKESAGYTIVDGKKIRLNNENIARFAADPVRGGISGKSERELMSRIRDQAMAEILKNSTSASFKDVERGFRDDAKKDRVTQLTITAPGLDQPQHAMARGGSAL